jgi:hypothetical protein
MDKNRRYFLRQYWVTQAAKVFNGFQKGIQSAQEQQTFDSFFESYESSYALTLAYPEEFLIDEAHKAGIEVNGREKIDIVKELFAKKRGFDHR